MKKIILLITGIFLIAFLMGCLGATGDFKETKLDVEEGIGVIGTLRIEELRPGLAGYISLTIRSNLEGAGASDIIISLDNVRPFKILECGEEISDVSENRKDTPGCLGNLDMDRDLPFKSRGTSRVFPGEELEVFWRLRAPGKDDISDIALRHPLYYSVEYTYSVNFRQNIIFMSQEEMLRRRERGEDYILHGETGSTAGEIRFSGATRQPIYYAFDFEPGGDAESEFDFVLSYSVDNRGKGFPLSDIVIILESLDDGVSYDLNLLEEYRWQTYENMKEETCHDGDKEVNCIEWLEEIFDEAWEESIDHENALYRIIRRHDFIDRFNIHTPLHITGGRDGEMTKLRDGNIPLTIYSFNVHAAYRYYIEGKEYINVYPLRGI